MTDPTPESGRELDAKVAEEIFGRVVVIAPVGDGLTRTEEMWGETMEEASASLREAYSKHKGLRDPYFDGPNYSTLIGAAWQVVEAMQARGIYVSLNTTKTLRDEFVGWTAEIGGRGVTAETAPLAICRAALAATKGNDD